MKTLNELLIWAKEYVANMTSKQKEEMLRQQANGWAKSEAQWAKDFANGKCERD